MICEKHINSIIKSPLRKFERKKCEKNKILKVFNE